VVSTDCIASVRSPDKCCTGCVLHEVAMAWGRGLAVLSIGASRTGRVWSRLLQNDEDAEPGLL
jgi:hypothetical protein